MNSNTNHDEHEPHEGGEYLDEVGNPTLNASDKDLRRGPRYSKEAEEGRTCEKLAHAILRRSILSQRPEAFFIFPRLGV